MSNTIDTLREETFYIVQYNDRYGNGDDKKIECIVKDKTTFKKWLKEHNSMRDAEPEKADEFDLIPIKLYY